MLRVHPSQQSTSSFWEGRHTSENHVIKRGGKKEKRKKRSKPQVDEKRFFHMLQEINTMGYEHYYKEKGNMTVSFVRSQLNSSAASGVSGKKISQAACLHQHCACLQVAAHCCPVQWCTTWQQHQPSPILYHFQSVGAINNILQFQSFHGKHWDRQSHSSQSFNRFMQSCW